MSRRQCFEHAYPPTGAPHVQLSAALSGPGPQSRMLATSCMCLSCTCTSTNWCTTCQVGALAMPYNSLRGPWTTTTTHDAGNMHMCACSCTRTSTNWCTTCQVGAFGNALHSLSISLIRNRQSAPQQHAATVQQYSNSCCIEAGVRHRAQPSHAAKCNTTAATAAVQCCATHASTATISSSSILKRRTCTVL
jgi:hypothetical protein